MSMLSKEQILAADDLVTEDVDVPEWGGTVRMRTLSGTERDAFEASSIKGNGKNRQVNLQNMRARLVALVLVDENGGRMFADAEVRALGRKSSKALDRLFDKARALNGLSEDDVEELSEGFGEAQSDEATSD